MARSSYSDLLKSRGFQSFLWTQFLGAFNDNVYKIIVSVMAVEIAADAGKGSSYLSLAGALFVVPFLLFSGYAGQVADKFSKTRVLVVTKSFEILFMLLAMGALVSHRIEYLLGVLFLLALQATFFSPAKYGIMPEMIADGDLSRANALLELSTFIAIVMGTSLGTLLYVHWKSEVWKMGAVLAAIAVAGSIASLGITKVKASGATSPFVLNPFGEVWAGTKRLYAEKPLWLTVLGISYFWFLGALFQLDLLLYGAEILKVGEREVGLLITCLAVGIGLGSIAAGRLSGEKVELGLVPIGSVGMGIFSMALHFSSSSYAWTALWLAFLGLFSGLFIVPLNAYLQQRGEGKETGRLIATNNFLNTLGVMLASGVLWLAHDKLGIGADTLLLYCGLVTIVATFYIASVVQEFAVRFLLWFVTHVFFKIRIVGQDNLPRKGAALLVANHVSHVDGFLIGGCIQRFIRFMVYRPFYESKSLGWFFRYTHAIPVAPGSRRDIVDSMVRARKELQEGHMVCIFAEGSITRTGNLLPFKRGVEKIAGDLNIPVIPVHLDRVWGSIFSFEGGKFFWKWPKQIPYEVTVSFGAPQVGKPNVQQLRNSVMEMGSAAVSMRKTKHDTLGHRFIAQARSNWSAFAMSDTTGKSLSFGEALTGAVLISDWVKANCAGQKMVGLMLPSSVGGALANIGVTLAGKTTVNLNFTAGKESIDSAIAQCELKTILTSKAFLEKAKLAELPGMVYLEDLKLGNKAAAFLRARLLPAGMLTAKVSPDDIATVIFSSGSTGSPKGVMLTHFNVASNIESIAQVYWVNSKDCIIGVLPFFHSFGYAFTLWFPLLSGFSVAYHANPMDAKIIGEIVQKHKATFLLSTPTFCAGYVRKCSKEEFATLRCVLVGAEKLRESIATSFHEKFGLPLLEGYGCTEMSPVVAVNTPDYDGPDKQTGCKPGTVGQPIPGVAVRVVDPETFEPVPQGKEGLLLVNGPNRMAGYIGQPEKTAQVLRDGWYVSGDIVMLDDEGFIRITDRLARFSKIGGEMVPHGRIEEAVNQFIGDAQCMVTSVPDEQRGERLVILYTKQDLEPAELWSQLSATDLPKLWIPKKDNLFRVESLPTLGTGKADLRGGKKLALELAGG